jgi:hypothetical protein
VARTKTQRNQKIDVTIKPWWQTQLFAAVVAGAIGSSPWIYDKYVEKKIVRDNVGLTFMFTPPEFKFSFNKTDPNLMDFEITGGTFDMRDSWIQMGDGDKQLTLGRGMHKGDFKAIVRGLVCNTWHYFRTEGIYDDGRKAFGPASRLNVPKCNDEASRVRIRTDPNFVESL